MLSKAKHLIFTSENSLKLIGTLVLLTVSDQNPAEAGQAVQVSDQLINERKAKKWQAVYAVGVFLSSTVVPFLSAPFPYRQ